MEAPQQGSAPKPVGQEFIIPALAVGFTIYYFWTVDELAWEAKANGVVIGALLLLLVALLCLRIGVQLARRQVSLRVTLGGEWRTDRMRLGLLAAMAVFMLALPWLGTIIALAALLFGTMWLLGARSWPSLVGISVGTPLLVWATLMVGLGTRFPAGPAERLLAMMFGIGAD